MERFHFKKAKKTFNSIQLLVSLFSFCDCFNMLGWMNSFKYSEFIFTLKESVHYAVTTSSRLFRDSKNFNLVFKPHQTTHFPAVLTNHVYPATFTLLFIHLPIPFCKAVYPLLKLCWVHRTPDGLRLAGTCGDHLAQPLLRHGHPELAAHKPLQRVSLLILKYHFLTWESYHESTVSSKETHVPITRVRSPLCAKE